MVARAINPRTLRQQYRTNPIRCVRELTEHLEEGNLKPADFSLAHLAESIMGREWMGGLRPKSGRYISMMEADAVKYSHFTNITGQIVFSAIKESYEMEEYVFSKLIETKPSDILDSEKIPGITEIGDEAEIVGETDPYPEVGVGEDYIEIGPKAKRGHIVPISKEAIRGDRTGVLIERCRKVGEWLGLNKEKRLIDAFIDENAGAKSAPQGGHRYHWKGTSYATYQTGTPWDNVVTSNALVDWTDVEQAELKLADIVDPFTGEPIMIHPTHIVVTPQNLHTARQILGATNLRLHAGGYATSGNLHERDAPNTLDHYEIVSSRLLKARAATDTDWWFGNPKEAICYVSNWDITTEEAPSNSEAAFRRDVVMQFKASEMGIAATKEPRVVVECRA